MTNFINNYSQNNTVDDKKTYLFFFPQTEGKNRDAAAFMPLNKQFGFVFVNAFATTNDMYTAAAHELGHGQFVLQHPFTPTYGERIPVADPYNLMCYGNGTQVAKWQWDIMHDPGVILRVFQSDEEGMQRYTACTAPEPTWLGSKEEEATITIGQVVSAYDGLMKNSPKTNCYKTWYWSVNDKKWLSPSDYQKRKNIEKGQIYKDKNGVFYEETENESYGLDYQVASDKIDTQNQYSLKPFSSSFTENENYQYAFLMAFEPDYFTVENGAYVDVSFRNIAKKVHSYFTIPASPGMDYNGDTSQDVHRIVLEALFSSYNDSISEAVKLIDRRTSWVNKIDVIDIGIFISIYREVLSGIINNAVRKNVFRAGSYIEKRAIAWIESKSIHLIAGRYNLQAISKEVGYNELIPKLLVKEGLTLQDFKYMIQKNTNALTQIEQVKLANIRNALPKPNANTLMQKIIKKDDIKKYLDGTFKPQVGGSVAIAADTKHLKTFEDYYFGLRLDYKSWNGKYDFFVEDNSCGVLRFKSKDSGTAIIPKGGTFDEWNYPFTSTGFTAGNNTRLGVPEWNLQKRVDLEDGAELWEVFNDGTEMLRAVYSEGERKFIQTK